MAKDKKSFILYADIIHTVELLSTEKAGELFLHILRYVNDRNPTTHDMTLRIAFEPIKQQLKRDLIKYGKIVEKRVIAGRRSAEQRKLALTHVNTSQQVSTVNGNDNVSVSVNDTVFHKEEGYSPSTPPPTFSEVEYFFRESGYNNAEKYFEYYSQSGWKDTRGNIIKDWKRKAKTVWFKPEDKIQTSSVSKINEGYERY